MAERGFRMTLGKFLDLIRIKAGDQMRRIKGESGSGRPVGEAANRKPLHHFPVGGRGAGMQNVPRRMQPPARYH